VTDETAGRPPATSADDPGSGLEGLTEDVLPALIARLRASRLGELEVRTADWRVRLRRDPSAPPRATAAAAHAADGAATPAELDGSVARSTAVGYFTPSPVLTVGQSVQAGDVIGLIDVLGIDQEVTAPADGIIASVLAEDGQAVEFGQALAQIDPLEDELADEDAEDLA
jgi:acetyl-CoA carboxylase biotin carboxyl carrier protein